MKVTYKWLKDFVDITLSPQALADKLTMAGLEVKSIDEKQGDFVFEIEITSNRPDWLSVIGIAREVAAITGKKLVVHSPKSTVRSKSKKNYRLPTIDYRLTSIKIEDKIDCPLYTATILENIKVKPSPKWLKERLELVGCRSVNNVVDITNYVLFETGHPLHAFDLDKIINGLTGCRVGELEIIVRRAKKDEELMAIDGIKRRLDENMLIISSGVNPKTRTLAHSPTEKPIAIAGVMGGKDTEVTQNTKNVLLEAAVFDPVVVRRGRQKLGLLSESSYRFERGVNADTLEDASLRTVALLKELAGAHCMYALAAGSKTKKIKRVSLDLTAVNNILNIKCVPAKIKSILAHLGFAMRAQSKNNLLVTIPSFRQDVVSQEDLIEEIARIYGYKNIPVSIPAIVPHAKSIEIRDIIGTLKQMLVGLGLQEVITYSLVDSNPLQENAASIEVQNPLSQEQAMVRTTLIPSIGRCIAYNLNQKQEYIALFEIAKRFYQTDNRINEEWALAIGICGVRSFLLAQGRVKDEMGLLHVKGIVETIMDRLCIKDYQFVSSGGSKVDVVVAKENIGVVSILGLDQKDPLGIKNKEVCVAQLSLEKLISFAQLKKRFVPLPLYPAIIRDISFVIKKEITVEALVAAIREKAGSLLREVFITDSYTGKQIPSGSKGLTISCVYRSEERTLIEDEITPLHALSSAVLVETFGATLR